MGPCKAAGRYPSPLYCESRIVIAVVEESLADYYQLYEEVSGHKIGVLGDQDKAARIKPKQV